MSAPRLLLCAALISVCSSQASDCSYLSLLKYLNLDTTNELLQVMRPVKNWTTPTKVMMDMYMYGILQVDEKSQTVTSHIWLQMSWQNEFLTWNSSDFCGIDELTIPISKVWVPDINIQEDASDTSSSRRGPLLKVGSYGWMLATARQRLTSTCQLKLRLFPFDIQECNITFGSMSSEDESIKLGTFSNETTLTRMSEQFMVTQGEWQLANIDISEYNISKSGRTQSKLLYKVKLVRKPLLYVVNFIVPLFYLLVLDVASFFISEGRGEKLSFKITILLSISVLLLILQDMLPSTEDQLPMIANYCAGIFALVGISVLEAMLVCFLSDRDGCCDKKTRRCADAEDEIQLETADCHQEPAGAGEKGRVKPAQCCSPLDGPSGRDLLRRILVEVKAARRRINREKDEKKKTGCCRRVAAVVDSAFFGLYLLTVLVFLTYMYLEWIMGVFQ